MADELEKAHRVLEKAQGLADQAEDALAATHHLAEQASAAVDALHQRDFFDNGEFGWELAALDKPETKHGKYTGAELDSRIAVRDGVVRLLAEGVGIRRIASMMRAQGVRIGEHSIMALRDRRPDLVATEKKQLSQQLGRISKLMADNIEERLVLGTMKPTPVDLAVIIDKKGAVDGEAGLIVEHRFTMDASADAFTKRLEEMKRAKIGAAVDSKADVIDLKP